MNSKLVIHHICILTDDYEASLEFYTNILEFKLFKETSPFHKRKYNSWLKKGDFYIELQTPNKNDEVVEFNNKALGISHFCIYDSDLDSLVSKYKNKGFKDFKLKNGKVIYEVEGGKLFKLMAPEGTTIEFRDTINL